MRIVDRIFTTMLLAGAGCFLIAASITVGDVLLRAALSKSIPAGVELTALFVGLGALLSIPHCFATNSHVTAKLLSEFFPRLLARPLFAIGALGSVIFAAVIFAAMAINTFEKLGSPETTPDAGLRVYMLLSVVTVVFFVSLIGSLLGIFHTEKVDVDHG